MSNTTVSRSKQTSTSAVSDGTDKKHTIERSSWSVVQVNQYSSSTMATDSGRTRPIMSLYTRQAPVPTAVKILATYDDNLGIADSMSFINSRTWMTISVSMRTVRDVWRGTLERLAWLVFISRSSKKDTATTVNKTVWTQHTALSTAAMSITV